MIRSAVIPSESNLLYFWSLSFVKQFVIIFSLLKRLFISSSSIKKDEKFAARMKLTLALMLANIRKLTARARANLGIT